MKAHKITTQKGQTLVLFAIGLLVLLAVSALVIDGGNMYLSRRVAQSAADAGALAGAYEMCAGAGVDAAIVTAERYAKEENGATDANAVKDTDEDGEPVIKVDATVEQKSFFAQLLGIDQIPVPATASAGCFPPRTVKNVLPVAWLCEPPNFEEPSNSVDCFIQSLDWNTELKPLVENTGTMSTVDDVLLDKEANPTLIQNASIPVDFNDLYLKNHLYIVMDTEKMEQDICDTWNCDIDGDGIIDVKAGGTRGWLYPSLEPGEDKNAHLLEIIKGDQIAMLNVHEWLEGKPGEINSGFDKLGDRIKTCINGADTLEKEAACRVFVLPVYSYFCPQDPKNQTLESCWDQFYIDEPSEIRSDDIFPDKFSEGGTYYHIIGFSEFYVTCVQKSGGKGNECPGYDVANGDIKNPDIKSTIEGYFVRNFPVEATGSGGTGGADLGLLLIRSLTK